MHPGVNSDSFVQGQANRIDQLKQVFQSAGLISQEDAYKTLMENSTKVKENIDKLMAQATRDGIHVTIASQ